MTAERTVAGPGRRGLRRGDLTRELIVGQSLHLLDTEGVAGFSLPKLGRVLGADPTAVYRHFASKDDLVLAIADELMQESLAGLEPSDCWIETLRDISRRLRRTYSEHPAAASLSSYRTTMGPAEMRAVDIIIGAVLAAGFEDAEAAVVYRALGDFNLSFCGFEASFLALDERLQKNDRDAWARGYLTAPRDQYPNIHQIREQLPEVSDDHIYETILSIVMAGLAARAPRPCPCPRHAPG
jgi:AcrR family transcriptional regulator